MAPSTYVRLRDNKTGMGVRDEGSSAQQDVITWHAFPLVQHICWAATATSGGTLFSEHGSRRSHALQLCTHTLFAMPSRRRASVVTASGSLLYTCWFAEGRSTAQTPNNHLAPQHARAGARKNWAGDGMWASWCVA